MTENEILKKAFDFLNERAAGTSMTIAIWRAPAMGRFRWDIFNIFDLAVCFKETGKTHFIQCTTYANRGARRRKIKAKFREIGFVIPNSYLFSWNKKINAFEIEGVNSLE